MTDRERFLNTAKGYIGTNGNFVCNTKLGLGAVYDWCAFAVSAVMKDCGFVGKYIKAVAGGAGDIPRISDIKYGDWFKKGTKAPQAGDLFFLRYADYPYQDKYFCDHVGIVESVNDNAITTLEKAMLAALRSNFRNVSNVLQEGTDADGGYLVPEEYDKRIIEVLNSENIMRTLGTKIKTGGDHKINIAATKPAASWIEEGEPLVWGDATFDQILLDAHKLHVAIKITEELLYDNSFGLESYITTQFGRALANAEEDAFLNGNGQGKPTGIFAATGGGKVAATTTALKGDDITSPRVKVLIRLLSAISCRAVIILRQTAEFITR